MISHGGNISEHPQAPLGTGGLLHANSSKKSGTANNIGKMLLNTSSVQKSQTPILPNLLNNTS